MGNLPAHVLLLRHGETEWNRAGRLQGREDSPLTERGLAQADALARAAAALGVARVLASPIGRARITAGRVAAATGLPLAMRDGLAEMSFGDCAGLTLDEVAARFPGLLEARARDRWGHRWPGGESYADVLARVQAALAADGPLCTTPPTAIVAHQSVNRTLLHWLAGCPIEEALASEQSADVIVRVNEGGAAWHARIGDGQDAAAFAWQPGPPLRADGSPAALRAQRIV